MRAYEIRPLKTGTIIVDKGAYVTRGKGLGEDLEIPATAWDAVFSYDNLEPESGHLTFTIMGRFMDIVASWRSLEEIVRRADVVLPGHDNRTMDVEVYPHRKDETG